jgi:hypothetical protein
MNSQTERNATVRFCTPAKTSSEFMLTKVVFVIFQAFFVMIDQLITPLLFDNTIIVLVQQHHLFLIRTAPP